VNPMEARRRRKRRGLIGAIVGVVIGVAVFAAFVLSAGHGKITPTFEDDQFVVGNAVFMAREVDSNGPLLFKDPTPGGGRDLFLVHQAGQWEAFEARQPNGCKLELDRAAKRLRDCNGAPVTSTEGLRHYRTIVDKKGKLIVDLRKAL
jgi:hypothetical protein